MIANIQELETLQNQLTKNANETDETNEADEINETNETNEELFQHCNDKDVKEFFLCLCIGTKPSTVS